MEGVQGCVKDSQPQVDVPLETRKTVMVGFNVVSHALTEADPDKATWDRVDDTFPVHLTLPNGKLVRVDGRVDAGKVCPFNAARVQLTAKQ